MSPDNLKYYGIQVKAKSKERWGILTNSEIWVREGKKENLIGKIEEQFRLTQVEVVSSLRKIKSVQVLPILPVGNLEKRGS